MTLIVAEDITLIGAYGSLSAAGAEIRGSRREASINPIHFNPVAVSALIVAGVMFLGAIIAFLRDRSVYRQHEEIASDARRLAAEFRGEVFRDGDDLVVSGAAGKLRVIVRFSYAENTPGVNIRMDVPANFQMSLAARGTTQLPGSSKISTDDKLFDARFAVRSNDPTQAEMFLGSQSVRTELSRLCCTSKAFVTIGRGVMEQSELVVPGDAGRHIANHIRSMQSLAEKLLKMPFAERIVLRAPVRERRAIGRIAIVIGVLATAVALYSATHEHEEAQFAGTAVDSGIPAGVAPNDALVIMGLRGWNLASVPDLDQDAVNWLRVAGVQATTRTPADFSGEGNDGDVAYLLTDNDKERRLIIISKKKVVYDAKYVYLGILAKIPKANLDKIEWASRQPEPPDGDALLVTRTPQDLSSGLILYLSGGQLVSGVPKNYQSLDPSE